jgi:hypothetical protein
MRADPKTVSNFIFAPKSEILNVLHFHAKKGKKLVKLSVFCGYSNAKAMRADSKTVWNFTQTFSRLFTKISSNRREEAFNSILGPKWKCLRSSHIYYWTGFNNINPIYQYFEDMPRQKQWGPIRKLWGTSSLRQNWQRLGRQEDDL